MYILFIYFFFFFNVIETKEIRPFPQHTEYTKGTIKPNVPQENLDSSVIDFYQEWSKRYLKQDPDYNDQYYVYYNLEGKSDPKNAVSASEGHGYGMMIEVLMAGEHEPKGKEIFDGMYKFWNRFQSVNTDGLMAWQQVLKKGHIINNPDGGDDSATDGDMDVAFSLLLADKQWGSEGEINYLQEAKRAIKGVMKGDVNPKQKTLTLGDWVDPDDPKYGPSTRPSDFMLSHLTYFAQYDENFNDVKNQTIKVINEIVENYSTNTSLLPDFVVFENSQYKPAKPFFLEDKTDGDYAYNSCRIPWRLTVDYLLSGNKELVPILTKLNDWIKKETKVNPENIHDGYHLTGKIESHDSDMAFTSPFMVSAMINSSNQEWIDSLWKSVIDMSAKEEDAYYGNTIKMLNLIVVSGNYWGP